jgi:3D (Asp-Asp-Asp) domain-containing protein
MGKKLKYNEERAEGVPCFNIHCNGDGFDKNYEQNCRLSINDGPFLPLCSQYFPEGGGAGPITRLKNFFLVILLAVLVSVVIWLFISYQVAANTPQQLPVTVMSDNPLPAENQIIVKDAEEKQVEEKQVERDRETEQRREKPSVSRAGTAVDFIATAYTQRVEEGTADGITATGTRVKPGVVAVDRSVIPLGSRLYIESDFPGVSGYYRAEDVGGSIKGQRLDIYMTDLGRAMDFGKRPVRVHVLQ